MTSTSSSAICWIWSGFAYWTEQSTHSALERIRISPSRVSNWLVKTASAKFPLKNRKRVMLIPSRQSLLRRCTRSLTFLTIPQCRAPKITHRFCIP
eukprot:23129_6